MFLDAGTYKEDGCFTDFYQQRLADSKFCVKQIIEITEYYFLLEIDLEQGQLFSIFEFQTRWLALLRDISIIQIMGGNSILFQYSNLDKSA
jgi:hypothetical protein